MVYELLRSLKAYPRLNLSVIVLNEGKFARELRKLGIGTAVIDESRMHFVHLLLNTLKLIRSISPDIIHSHRYKENILATICANYLSAQTGLPNRSSHSREGGDPLDSLNALDSRFRGNDDLAGYCELAAKGRSIGNDALECGRLFASGYIKSPPRPKLVTTLHGMPETHARGMRFQQKALAGINFKLLSRSFHRIVAVSSDIKDRLVREHGFQSERVAVVHNGIAIPEIIPRKKEDEPFVVGSAGRFFPVKDYGLMVEIAKLVINGSHNIGFALAGEGPEMGKIKDLMNKYNLKDYFALPGFTDDIDVFYDSLHIYLNTSLHEGIPMSVLEAMAHEVPVIAPAVGGLKDIIENGKQGFLIENRAPEAFAEKCRRLYEDRGLHQRMAQAARQRVIDEFSVHRTAEKYYRIYLDVAG